jgi:hypothetical protein
MLIQPSEAPSHDPTSNTISGQCICTKPEPYYKPKRSTHISKTELKLHVTCWMSLLITCKFLKIGKRNIKFY